MLPLAAALTEAARAVRTCRLCGNLDSRDPCTHLRRPATATARVICVVEGVGDLWALERAARASRALPRARRHAVGAGRHRAGGS